MNTVSRTTTTRLRMMAVLLSFALLAGTAPATASAMTEAQPLQVTEKFASSLDPDAAPPTVATKAGTGDTANQAQADYTTPLVRAKAPLPKPRPVAATTTRTVRTAGTASTTTKNTGSTSAPPAQKSSGDTLSTAQAILASRIAMYPILQGATVQIGDTRGNPQGICYYKSARIVINANHTVSLERIINHEIWHIIYWRDNGSIDWGESVPPSNAGDYRG